MVTIQMDLVNENMGVQDVSVAAILKATVCFSQQSRVLSTVYTKPHPLQFIVY